MTEYQFIAEEPVWYKSRWESYENEDGEAKMRENGAGEVVDAVEGERGYYWIESVDREQFLAVPDFMTGEEALMKLQNSDKTFEDLLEMEKFETCELVEEVQEVYDLYF